MKNIGMKNVIMGSVLAVAAVTSLSANAAVVDVCTGGVAKDGTKFTSASTFVKIEFTPKCSANVLLAGDESSSTLFKVGAASLKGKNMFAGSTAGGSVGNVGPCDKDPCEGGSQTTAIGKAPS